MLPLKQTRKKGRHGESELEKQSHPAHKYGGEERKGKRWGCIAWGSFDSLMRELHKERARERESVERERESK